MRYLTILSITLLMASCAGTPQKPSVVYDLSNTSVTGHEAKVKKFMGGLLKDPYSAKYRISAPKIEMCRPTLFTSERIKMWASLALINSKNSFGAYTGDQGYKIYYANNDVLTYFPTKQGVTDLCPIGEMEKIKEMAK